MKNFLFGFLFAFLGTSDASEKKDMRFQDPFESMPLWIWLAEKEDEKRPSGASFAIKKPKKTLK